tara:strand:- start:8775 stop:9359 length:585 start_codon:yes stop_codon:yes gene_type:complete
MKKVYKIYLLFVIKGDKVRQKRRFNLLKVLLIIGMLVSLFLVYEHFSPNASKFCSFGDSFDCGIVNKSPYANLDGLSYLLTIDLKLPIPLIDISGINLFFDLITGNAFLGFLALAFVFFVYGARRSKNILFIKKGRGLNWVVGILGFGVIYGFYLFLIQHYILKTYCIFCLGLDFVLIVSLIVAWKELRNEKKK